MKIGIAGGGQLGWMMINQGRKLGYHFNAIDRDLDYPGLRDADRGFRYDQYREFVDESDVVTYEFEHVDDRVLEYADRQGKLLPGMEPVMLKRDRSKEKIFLQRNGFPVARFFVADSIDHIAGEIDRFHKAVAKSTTGGYDGKGQYIITDGKIPPGMPEDRYVVEEFVAYDTEASVIASRDVDGRKAFHLASKNVNSKGMLLYNVAPMDDFGMREIVSSLLDRLHYVGTIGVEFFIKNGRPLVNEFSPRVHNSGHHTLLGSSISQFEQHVRAISGLPVPEPQLFVPSGILNIIGREIDHDMMSRILAVQGTQVYWYGKAGIRPRRKVGHVNVVSGTAEGVEEKIRSLMEILYGERLEDFLIY